MRAAWSAVVYRGGAPDNRGPGAMSVYQSEHWLTRGYRWRGNGRPEGIKAYQYLAVVGQQHEGIAVPVLALREDIGGPGHSCWYFRFANSLDWSFNLCDGHSQGFECRWLLSRGGIHLICREGRAGHQGSQPQAERGKICFQYIFNMTFASNIPQEYCQMSLEGTSTHIPCWSPLENWQVHTYKHTLQDNPRYWVFN